MTAQDLAKLGQAMDNKGRYLAFLAAIACASAMRLVPHPPNFTPVAAIALLSGAYMPRRAISFAAPFGALLLSDSLLGFYPGAGFVYAGFALTILVGWILSSRKSPLSIAAAAVASSVLFFVLTNFGVWLLSGMYSRTAAGLVDCYVAAIPFFRNSVAGDLFYSAVLFGLFALLPQARQGAPLAEA